MHSGMPLRLAHRKCPDGVFLPSDHTAYDAASAEVMAVLRSFGYPVEVWGWDEAALAAETDDPETLAESIRGAVLAETGLDLRGRDRGDQGAGQDGDRFRQGLGGEGLPAVLGSTGCR